MFRRPLTLVFAAAVEALYGVALAGAGLFWLVLTTLGHAEDLMAAFGVALFAVGTGVVLCLAAWGLFTRRNWARTPVVLTQLFALGIAWYQLTAEPYTLGAALGLLSAVTLGCVLAPATTTALFPEEHGGSTAEEGSADGSRPRSSPPRGPRSGD
ncbi:hypothetical protein [Lipingzhangella rawalii]|uniref:hypothetical protein n=1 Tax=Lipingzhangella rawalii TaxID=2055835 RepID=UPI00287BBCAF|nr:hypothetical protein [Lipingzhangella rawalii]